MREVTGDFKSLIDKVTAQRFVKLRNCENSCRWKSSVILVRRYNATTPQRCKVNLWKLYWHQSCVSHGDATVLFSKRNATTHIYMELCAFCKMLHFFFVWIGVNCVAVGWTVPLKQQIAQLFAFHSVLSRIYQEIISCLIPCTIH